MRISLSARIVEGMTPRPTIEEFLSLASRTGYDGVGLRSWQIPPEMDDDWVASLDGLLRWSRLSVCSLVPPPVPPADWGRVVATARRLGVKVIQASDAVEELSRKAKALDADMRIGPQVHTGGSFEDVGSAAKALAQATDRRVGAIAEPGNFMLAGVAREPGFLAPLRGRIIGCYLQSVEVFDTDVAGTSRLTLRDGSVRYFRRVSLGENRQINLEVFLRELREAGYDDFINVLEPAQAGITVEDLAADTAQALRQILGSASRRA
ncbi:MAG: sugar phosphate isomerase/epimerase [Armatimonadetes bacterium]|nr:sugar phosphate isomerase/epimerase [Armatimonadota bacterium]